MKAVSGITDVSAVVNWTTNENSTSQVEYGKTASYGKESALDSTLTLTHKVTLSGLEPNTTYHYRVVSVDSSGNTITFDEDRTFTTLAAVAEGTNVGNRAPDFDLGSLDDQYISLSQYRGKTVVLNFWYVTCAPCIEEMPYFQDLEEQWSGDTDIVILAVNYQNDPTTVQDFVDIGQYTFTVLLDTDGAVGAQFANLFPTTYFIDASGVIQYKKEGNFSNLAEIVSVLESID
jgi:peroxiredoxin